MTWVVNNLDVIANATWWHLVQAIPAIVVSFVLAVVIAKVADSARVARSTVSAASSLLYAIPSLPLFIMLPIMLGTGLRSPVNVMIALTLYGLAIMTPGALTACRSVDQSVLSAATAQGYAPLARFVQVELPLAGPALVATLRVVSVSTISLVTVGGVLGIPSLGMLFTDGFQRGITEQILTGIIVTAAIALIVDVALVVAARFLMPWTRTGAGQSAAPAEVEVTA